MKKNYLMDNNADSIKKYTNASSYLSTEEEIDCNSSNYFLLPEEYDIFSGLNYGELSTALKEKYPLAIKLLTSFKLRLQNIAKNNGILCILPKLLLNNDEKGTITFNLVNANFRIFFSFESMEIGGMAYCGLVVHEAAPSMITQSKLISETNYDSIVELVLKIMFENS